MAAQAGTITDSLMSTTLNPTLWTVSQTTANLYTVTPTSSGLDISYNGPSNPGGTQEAGINLNMAAVGGNITGDFSTSVTFSDADLSGVGLDQVEFHTVYTDNSIIFDSDSSGGSGVHVYTGSVQTTIDPTETSGTFTVSSVGGVLSGYYDGTPMFSIADTASLDAIAFTLQNNNGSNDPTSVTFTDFSLTAGSISSSAPEPGTAWLLAAALAGLTAAGRIFSRAKSCGR
jgi:hypothetical protein